MRKKPKDRNIEQEIVWTRINDLTDLLQKRDIFKKHLEEIPNRAKDILESDLAQLYESRQDVEELYMHFHFMEEEFKIAMKEIDNNIMDAENSLTNAVGKFMATERNLLDIVKETYIPDDEAPF
jgi:hypothetical protein